MIRCASIEDALDEYIREDLAELDNPHRQDRLLLRDLAHLFRTYRYLHSPSPSNKEENHGLQSCNQG